MPAIEPFPLIVWLYAAVMLSGGLMLCVLTPAFQVPDEPAHFFRAYQVSRGILLGQRNADTAGGEVPLAYRDLLSLAPPLLEGGKLTGDTSLAQWHLRTEGTLVSMRFPNTAAYAALGYLPQASALRVSGLVTSQVMWHLIAARMANFIFFVFLVSLAMVVFPPCVPAFIFLSALPMVLFLAASVSQDATIIGISALYAALLLGLLSDQSAAHDGCSPRMFWRDCLLLVAAAFAALVLTLARPPYIILALMLPVTASLHPNRRRLVFPALGLVAFINVCAAGLLVYDRAIGALVVLEGVADPSVQINFVLTEPVKFLQIMIHTYFSSGTKLREMLGVLGWLDTVLPNNSYIYYKKASCIAGVLLIISASCWGESMPGNRTRWIFAIAAVVSAAGSLLALSLILYVSGSSVGADTFGVQGRYLLPYAIVVVPAGGVVLAGLRMFRWPMKWAGWPRVAEIGNIVLLMGLGASQCYLSWVILDRYYPPIPGITQ